MLGPNGNPGPGNSVDDMLLEAEAAVAELAKNFTTWVQDDIKAALDALNRAKQNQAGNNGEIEEIFSICHNIKGQAGSFGYDLMTKIGGELCDLIRDRKAAAEADLLKAIEGHLSALKFLAARGIDGDGGEIGQKLVVKLRQLAAKAR